MTRPAEWTIPALAYLGDAVMEVFVREHLVAKGLAHSAVLNREALKYVRASAQAAAADRLLPLLSEEETAWFHRGRNSKHLNFPKNADPADYRKATGLEVLFGYLHESGQNDRARELFAAGYELQKESMKKEEQKHEKSEN